MNQFTPWSALTDASLIGLLLLIGVLLRAKLPPLQALMMPSSFIAGVLGLAFGPLGLGWLPLSTQIGTYSSILIVVVFACLALSDDFNLLDIKGPILGFSAYSVLMYAIQVSLGMLVVLAFLKPTMGVGDGFGILIFAGWAGGFGTAAAVGQVFTDAGQPEMQSLAFMAATVGLLVGIIGGIAQTKVGATRGYAQEFEGMDKLPEEFRTGLLAVDDPTEPIGHHKFSGSSIESLGFQASLVLAVSGAAYGISLLLKDLFPDVSFPVFSIAFAVGLIVRPILRMVRANRYIDRPTMNSISGTATDLLIVCGIASIQLRLVADNWLAMLILFSFGLALCLGLGLIVAPRTLKNGWFEKQIFTWGWATGAVNTGIALLRIVDPKMKSKTMEDFAIAYIPVVPIEIAAVTFVPALVIAGLSWYVVGIWGVISVAAIAVMVMVAQRDRRARA